MIGGKLDLADRARASLLGGAIGDALGAGIEFISIGSIRARFGDDGVTDYVEAFGRRGAITDDTQMTLFTAEGLIRAGTRFLDRGLCHPPSVVWNAYQRWLWTQQPFEPPGNWLLTGHLIDEPVLRARRAPGNTCLSALEGNTMGTTKERINDSKGCGGVMRVAPVAFIASDPFEMATDLAALTHGHPSGFYSAGAFAAIIAGVARGATIEDAVEQALLQLQRHPDASEVEQALIGARDAAATLPATPESIQSLGGGWVAEEALAIAVFCALKATSFEHGVLLAVNHSGDSDSTGSMAGNLLGAMWGMEVLPQRWLDELEARDLIDGIARDLMAVQEFSSDITFIGMEPTGRETPAEFRRRYPPV